MSLKALAEHYNAYVTGDGASFQRRARVLQSMWRDGMGYPACPYRDGLLGSRMPLPWAKETLANFLTDNIRQVVRSDVLDGGPDDERLIQPDRLLGNLLSSQPLCFNLFGELTVDLELASRVVSRLTDGRFARVTEIKFEYSPGRSDPRYTNDKSAFDVFLRCKTATGDRAFLGIEVKYHENLQDKPGRHRGRYDEVAAMMGCFKPEASERLREKPLQQIWRDHLLAGSVKSQDAYADAAFVFLYPRDNARCEAAVAHYGDCLSDTGTFIPWTLKTVVEALEAEADTVWVKSFINRYLAFEKLKGM